MRCYLAVQCFCAFEMERGSYVFGMCHRFREAFLGVCYIVQCTEVSFVALDNRISPFTSLPATNSLNNLSL